MASLQLLALLTVLTIMDGAANDGPRTIKCAYGAGTKFCGAMVSVYHQNAETIKNLTEPVFLNVKSRVESANIQIQAVLKTKEKTELLMRSRSAFETETSAFFALRVSCNGTVRVGTRCGAVSRSIYLGFINTMWGIMELLTQSKRNEIQNLYEAWKVGYKIEDLYTLGTNISKILESI